MAEPACSFTPLDERVIENQAMEIAYRVVNARRLEWPFPHAMMVDILPTPLFAQLRALRLSSEELVSHGHVSDVVEAERHRFRVAVTPDDLGPASTVNPVLRHVYSVLSHARSRWALTRLFGKELVAAFAQASLPLSATLSYVEDRSGYALLPHTDVPHKAVTLLVYLADDDSDPSLGTELYTAAPGVALTGGFPMRGRFNRSPFVHVTTAPYRPNHGIVFPPSERSFHGVREVDGAERTRRLIQFQLSVDDLSIRRVGDPARGARPGG